MSAGQFRVRFRFHPDAVFLAVVALGLEREHGVGDQDVTRRGGDLHVPVVLAGQRVMRAQHHLAGAASAEQQITRGAEVMGVAVVALAADAV